MKRHLPIVERCLPGDRVGAPKGIRGPAFERKPHSVNRIETHQVSGLNHEAQGVPTRVVGVRELLGHVGVLHVGPVDAVREPDPATPPLDRDLAQLPLPGAHHLQQPVVRRAVDPAPEDVLADYASHGLGTSIEVASFTEPDPPIDDMPDAGDQRSEGPVGADAELAIG